MVTRLLAVADDLTGANGLGGRWAGRGADVCVAGSAAELRGEDGCRVLNAETRLLAPGAARAAVQAAWVGLDGAGLRYQKIDSTLRGNPGEEIEGLLSACAAPWVAVLPAYPALGRQVLGGRVLVHGRPLDATEYVRDPLTPSRAAGPAALFPAGLAAHAPLRAVSGVAALRAWLRRARAGGRRFVSFDCAEDAHVRRIADACLAEGCRHFAGAADLGGALAGRLLGPATPARRPPEVPFIVLAGSVSATSFGQLRAWRDAGRPWRARLTRRGKGWSAEGAGGRAALRRNLRRGRGLALSSLGSREDLAPWLREQARLGADAPRCAGQAMAALAAWGLAVAGGFGRCGWFVTGGHTLAALRDQAGFTRYRIAGEVLPEVPLGRAEGPRGWTWLCSKPGGFGAEDCFNRFMEAGA